MVYLQKLIIAQYRVEESQKVNNNIGWNNSIVWKSKKWYTTNRKSKKMLEKVITVYMDLNKESL